MAIIQGNSLQAISPVFIPQTRVYGDITGSGYWDMWEIYTKYPQISNGLICLWKEESTYGIDNLGDNGLAIGPFQIHVWQHPDITYECANNFSCSLDWTVKQIKNGYGHWWTPIKDGRCRVLQKLTLNN